MLAQLGTDEGTAGNWVNTYSGNVLNPFPAGTKLEYVSGNGPGSGFWVSGPNDFLLGVAGIVTLATTGQNGIMSGIASAAGGFVQTNVQIATFTYDATSSGGTTKYNVFGLGTTTIRTTNPTASGGYVQSVSFSLQNGTGEGVNADGVKIILTDVTITAAGSQRFGNGTGTGLESFTLIAATNTAGTNGPSIQDERAAPKSKSR